MKEGKWTWFKTPQSGINTGRVGDNSCWTQVKRGLFGVGPRPVCMENVFDCPSSHIRTKKKKILVTITVYSKGFFETR